jgi:hypothetical protein
LIEASEETTSPTTTCALAGCAKKSTIVPIASRWDLINMNDYWNTRPVLMLPKTKEKARFDRALSGPVKFLSAVAYKFVLLDLRRYRQSI